MRRGFKGPELQETEGGMRRRMKRMQHTHEKESRGRSKDRWRKGTGEMLVRRVEKKKVEEETNRRIKEMKTKRRRGCSRRGGKR